MTTRNCVQLTRKRRGLTVSELARRVGVSRQTVDAIERNPGYEPKAGLMFALAQVLNEDVATLFWSEPERKGGVA